MIYFKKIFNQKIVIPILIICLVSSITGSVLFYPREAQAAIPVSIVADTDQPVEMGWNVADVIYKGLDLGEQFVQTATELWEKAKDLTKWALGKALNTLLHRLLAQITNDITSWIQNGGEPRFLSMGLDDWISGELDKTGGAFVEQYLGAGWLCEPFDLELKLAFLDVPTYTEEAQCTLSNVTDNIDAFYDDFSQGGWASFIALTEPQNNLYGAYLMAQYELELVEAKAEEDLKQDLANSQGYKSMKECVWYQNETEKQKGRDSKGNPIGSTVGGKLTDVMGIPTLPPGCYAGAGPSYDNPGWTKGGFQGPCVSECTVLTTGSTIKTMADKTTTNFLDKLNAQISAAMEKAGPFEVYIQAILNALANRVMTEGVGLLRAGTENDPAGAFKVPEYGDLGAATTTPNIVDPANLINEQKNANLLIGQLEVLKKKLDEIKNDTATRINNLELVLPLYDDIITDLKTLESCIDSAIAGWASNKLDEIQTMKSSRETELAVLKNWQQAIDDNEIPDAIILVQTFIDKVDEYIEIWEKYGGIMPTKDGEIDPDSEFAIAHRELIETRDVAMEVTKEILSKFVNLTNYSDDFAGLTKVVKDATMKVHNQGMVMKVYPGDDLVSGARGIQSEVRDYMAKCSFFTMTTEQFDESQEKLDAIKESVDNIEIDVNVYID